METFSILIPIFTTLIGAGTTLLVIWYKHRLTSLELDKGDCPIGTCIVEDNIILEKLDEVLVNTGGDRICIFSFHNGGQYYSGKSMQKMSMSHEQVDSGISSIQLSKQNIPVSACISTLKPLMLNRELCQVDTKKYQDGLCKYHLLQDGVKSTYYWPIIDIHNNAIGVLRLDYVKRKTKITQEDKLSMELLSTQLPGYLVRS
jgi:hypothetical protein